MPSLINPVTKAKGRDYKQHVHGNLTETHQRDLISVSRNCTKTYNGKSTLDIKDSTTVSYNKYVLHGHGAYNETATGDQMHTYSGSEMCIHVGARSTMKVGPVFFTGVGNHMQMTFLSQVTCTTMGVGLSIARTEKVIGASLQVYGVETYTNYTLKQEPAPAPVPAAPVVLEEVDLEISAYAVYKEPPPPPPLSPYSELYGKDLWGRSQNGGVSILEQIAITAAAMAAGIPLLTPGGGVLTAYSLLRRLFEKKVSEADIMAHAPPGIAPNPRTTVFVGPSAMTYKGPATPTGKQVDQNREKYNAHADWLRTFDAGMVAYTPS